MRKTWLTLLIACAAMSFHPERLQAADEDRTQFPGQILSGKEFAAIVTDKHRTLAIAGGFVTDDPKLRTIQGKWATTQVFHPGDTARMEFHIGVVEAKFKLSTKAFPTPEPKMVLYKDGKVVETLQLIKGACCGGTMPFSLAITSLMQPGDHEVQVTAEYPKGNVLPPQTFKFRIENPTFGQHASDSDQETLKTQFPGSTVVRLQQGAPVPEWKVAAYAGCQDTNIETAWGGGDHRNRNHVNFGTLMDLNVGFYGPENRALIQFDLSGIPQNAQIQKVILKLHLDQGGPLEVNAYPVKQAWIQGRGNGDQYDKARGPIKDGECSWDCRQFPNVKWAAPGCGKAGEDYAETAIPSQCAEAQNPKATLEKVWVRWDLTAAAQAWAKTPDSNHGVVLIGTHKSPRPSFRSAEYNDPDFRPTLVVVYK